LIPVILLYLIYDNYKKRKEQEWRLVREVPNKTMVVHPWRILILLAFFCLGLTPIFVH